MKMTSGWMRVGVVGAMMVAATMAGAQTTAEDAANAQAAEAAHVQADEAVQAANTQVEAANSEADEVAQAAEVQAKDAAQVAADVQLGKIQVQLDRMAPEMSAAQSAAVEAQVKRAQEQLDRMGPALTEAQSAEVEARVERAQVELQRAAPRLSKLGTLDSAQMARVQAQLARMAPMQAEMQARMAPMEAQLEMKMVPLQAEMMARSATMRAQMMARSLSMQDGMVAMGDPQVKDELFAGTEKFANGASDVTDVNLGPDMLGMVTGKHGGNMAHKLNFMVVKTYEYPKPGMYNPADVDVYRQKLKAGNWNCFIHTHETKTGESTDICNRALPNGQGNEMVILTVEPKELTFIHMSGNGSLADLGKLGSMGGYGGNIPTPPEPPTPPAPQSPRQ